MSEFVAGIEEAAPSSEPTYRMRLRFRLQKKLNVASNDLRFTVAGREIVLSAPVPDTTISDSEWLIANARGLPSEQEAVEFGHKLRVAIELASVAARLGVDAGRDVATSGLGKVVRESIAAESGTLVRDNVHGLDIFEDDPRVRFFTMNMTGTVRANPEPFLPFAAELFEQAASLSDKARDMILLLNYALMRPEPVAQIVFAFSAVEMMGQSENWSNDQKKLLAELASTAEGDTTVNERERLEVATAIRKSMHRISLRQGVFRLLDRLDLTDLKKSWDDLYAERSTLVHGLAPRPGADYGDLAFRAVSLCGRILLKAIAEELPAANRYVDTFFELPRPSR